LESLFPGIGSTSKEYKGEETTEQNPHRIGVGLFFAR
jgi:hypothetical protein